MMRSWENRTVSDGAGSSGPKRSSAASLYVPNAAGPSLAVNSLQASPDGTEVDVAELVVVVVLVAVVVAVAGTVVEVGVAVVTTAEDAVGAAVRQLTVAIMMATTARTWFRFTIR
ncbi:MAG: hypothetical protein JJD93_18350 [Ilumatobacteraceae bacterium]|nr:hypothetical protein [Ilumatobacteraceae bacterium]